jgi:hypothetical protein
VTVAKTPLRNFRCDDQRWEAFMAACAADRTDASREIREMIDAWLDEWQRRTPKETP